MRSITTELFFENSEYVDNDAVFGVRKSLIARVVPLKKSDEPEFKLARRPDARVAFDIVLAPEG
jgi:hydroxyquinol 1,2-dioxygenase